MYSCGTGSRRSFLGCQPTQEIGKHDNRVSRNARTDARRRLLMLNLMGQFYRRCDQFTKLGVVRSGDGVFNEATNAELGLVTTWRLLSCAEVELRIINNVTQRLQDTHARRSYDAVALRSGGGSESLPQLLNLVIDYRPIEATARGD